MAKIFDLQATTTASLEKRKQAILAGLTVPIHAIRASCVEQYLTCGKSNCRCRLGRKHGPFQYLVQSLRTRKTRKFLLRTPMQKQSASAATQAYVAFQQKLEELSQINTELLRRGENLRA
jgi:hypothetical protein